MGRFWAEFGGENVIEIIIRDNSGSKIDTFRFGAKNHNEKIKVFKIIKRKYGVDLFLRENKDLSWLKQDELS